DQGWSPASRGNPSRNLALHVGGTRGFRQNGLAPSARAPTLRLRGLSRAAFQRPGAEGAWRFARSGRALVEQSLHVTEVFGARGVLGFARAKTRIRLGPKLGPCL